MTGKDDLSKVHGMYYHDFSESRFNVDVYRFDNIKTSFLTEGDTIDLNTWEITIRSDKVNIAGNESREWPLAPSDDIFNDRSGSSPDTMTNHFLALVDSRNGEGTYGYTT